MKISDLQARQGKIEIEAKVIDKEEPRTFEKFGKSGKVCNAKIRDDSGEVKLTLWNEQVDQVKKGDRVRISNGYVNEYQGELQLTTGKFGKLEVLGDAMLTGDEKLEEELLHGKEKQDLKEAVTEDELDDQHTEEDKRILTEDAELEEELLFEEEVEPSEEESLTDDEKELALPVGKKKLPKTEEKELDDIQQQVDEEELDIEEEKIE